jgi:hypothetical protein
VKAPTPSLAVTRADRVAAMITMSGLGAVARFDADLFSAGSPATLVARLE